MPEIHLKLMHASYNMYNAEALKVKTTERRAHKYNTSSKTIAQLTSEYRRHDATKTRCLFVSAIGMFNIGDNTLYIINFVSVQC